MAEHAMNLFEAIVEANHRAAAGDNSAGLRPAEFAAALPIVALTCIDVRLNSLLPAVLGIQAEDFIWLRNAGNIITGPLSSTIRSLALACTIKGGQEIAVIGHTDCRVRQTTVLELTDRFRALGIDRSQLPDNLNEYFGLFASEHQNVVKAVDFIRRSPLISPKVPVHGLLVNVQSGQLDWVVNGYLAMAPKPETGPAPQSTARSLLAPVFAAFNLGEMKFPAAKIGEGRRAQEELSQLATPEASDAPPPPKPKVEPPKAPPPLRSGVIRPLGSSLRKARQTQGRPNRPGV